MDAFDFLQVHLDAGVALVTLNRAPVNALNRQARTEITTAFSMLNDEPDVRVIILTGHGKLFSAGADLTDRPDATAAGAYTIHNRQVRECFLSVFECSKPVIAAINGPAIGAGLVLATCCDILIAQENAWVSMPEVEVGLAGGPKHVMRHFGASDARLLMYTARRFSAPELFRMNVLSACVTADALQDTARTIADEIASKSSAAVQAAKSSFILGEELSLHSAYRHEQKQTELLAKGPDFAKARAAFQQKG